MSDNNPPGDSENNETTIPEADEQPPMSEQDLERVFEEWGQKRSDFLGTDSGDEAIDLGDVDDEVASQAQLRLDKSRKAINSRLILLIVLATVGAATLVFNWSDINYYFVSESDRVDLGDLRERWKSGERPGDGTFPELKTNSWVQFEEAITTSERETDSGTYFFFEPMLKAIVVTTRAIPEKNPRNISLDSRMQNLIQQKWMYPSDISVSFSGQGRLIRADDAPRRLQPVVRLYRRELRLGSRLKEDQALWLIEDEQTPDKQFTYLLIYAVTILLIGFSMWFYQRARRRHAELVEELVADNQSGL